MSLSLQREIQHQSIVKTFDKSYLGVNSYFKSLNQVEHLGYEQKLFLFDQPIINEKLFSGRFINGNKPRALCSVTHKDDSDYFIRKTL